LRYGGEYDLYYSEAKNSRDLMKNMVDFLIKIVQMLKQNETIISSVAGLF
jgi:hypothetical protein